MRFDVKLILIS